MKLPITGPNFIFLPPCLDTLETMPIFSDILDSLELNFSKISETFLEHFCDYIIQRILSASKR